MTSMNMHVVRIFENTFNFVDHFFQGIGSNIFPFLGIEEAMTLLKF